MDVTFNFDPVCPWTWMTSRWLLHAADAEGFEIRFAPLSLAHLNRDNDDIPEQQHELHELGRGLLRVVAHLEAAEDQAAIARLYEAYGDLVHRREVEPTAALVAQAMDAAALDESARAASDDESLDEQIGQRTDAVVAAVGGDVGSPVLTWRSEDAEHAVFGPLINEVPDRDDGVELWRATRTLAELGPFAELKLARGELQLAAS